MVSVNNENKDYVMDTTKRKSLDKVWLGGNDIEKEASWRWTDCTPWEFNFWGEGQPDNGMFGDEDCLAFHHNEFPYRWHDDDCFKEKSFVCSRKICSGTS